LKACAIAAIDGFAANTPMVHEYAGVKRKRRRVVAADAIPSAASGDRRGALGRSPARASA